MHQEAVHHLDRQEELLVVLGPSADGLAVHQGVPLEMLMVQEAD